MQRSLSFSPRYEWKKSNRFFFCMDERNSSVGYSIQHLAGPPAAKYLNLIGCTLCSVDNFPPGSFYKRWTKWCRQGDPQLEFWQSQQESYEFWTVYGQLYAPLIMILADPCCVASENSQLPLETISAAHEVSACVWRKPIYVCREAAYCSIAE